MAQGKCKECKEKGRNPVGLHSDGAQRVRRSRVAGEVPANLESGVTNLRSGALRVGRSGQSGVQ
uniref:Uncharacterized protein n=1 Tax=Theropithecus gelada TaxID=9565 RepID=A0A8D2FB06_THEGE